MLSIAPFPEKSDAPSEIPDEAAPIWAEVVPDLERQHGRVDRQLLVDYVLALWARNMAASVLEQTRVAGDDISRPLGALNRASKRLSELRAELELSPKEARAARGPAEETLGEELARELG